VRGICGGGGVAGGVVSGTEAAGESFGLHAGAIVIWGIAGGERECAGGEDGVGFAGDSWRA